MKDLIANNAKIVLEYGQYILVILILICFFIIYKIGKNHRFYLPKSLLGWLGFLLALLVIFVSSVSIIGLQNEKATTGKVLNHFETMLMEKAPELTFKLVSDDLSSNLTKYEGKIIILNLWATWCAPCIKEMPDLNKLHNNFKDDGLVVIILSDESREKLQNFHNSNEFNFISVYNKQIEWLDMQIGTARPLTFIIDRNGIVTEYHTGVRNYDFYAKKIKALL